MRYNYPTKQVIVIRKDLKMRRGKEIAQGAHASMKFLIPEKITLIGFIKHYFRLSDFAKSWLGGIFTKVVCQVNSEEEIIELSKAAKDLGVLSYIITDCGLTEFNNVPTITAVAIGPDDHHIIDSITEHLKLY